MNDILPKYGYLAFDATSMKAFLKQRLIDGGVFSDQIYEGSNLSQIIDVFALTFQNLIFYMNKTGAEGLFSDAQIYENLNRIVKSLGYNPIGAQTSLLPYRFSASELLPEKTYIIPRYSKINVAGADYSFPSDVVFNPANHDKDGNINNLSVPQVLYQGNYEEYPEYEATGDEYEIVELNPGELIIIDHFSIDVYVWYESDGKWHQAKRTESLYLNNAEDNAYECRMNESGYYELKFGNDICGRKLKFGDKVQIYYLRSSGPSVSVAAGDLARRSVVPYQLDRYEKIMADVRDAGGAIPITNANSGFLHFNNDSSSTYFSQPEDPASIRFNAPASFRSQYRLVTAGDFETFVRTNFSNFVHSVSVMNNWEYINTYLRYFYDIGLARPSSDTRTALAQFMFADSCNFNNVYIFAVPKIIPAGKDYEYIPTELKSAMVGDMQDTKTLTCEPVVIDPVYMGFRIGISAPGAKPRVSDGDSCKLVLTKEPNSLRSSNSILSDAEQIIKNFFSVSNNKLGGVLNVSELSQNLMSIPGVSGITTERKNDDGTTTTVYGLSLLMYNGTYSDVCEQTISNVSLAKFQFPYYHKPDSLSEHIEVRKTTSDHNTIEY